MAKKQPATQVHVVIIGYSAVAVPDAATLGTLMKALSRCQVVEEDFQGGYWKPTWHREGIAFKQIDAEKLHLDRCRPKEGCKADAGKPSDPVDVGDVFASPLYDSVDPVPPRVRAKRLTHQQLLLGSDER